MRAAGCGFRVQSSGFRIQGSGFRVQGSEFRVQDSGLRIAALIDGDRESPEVLPESTIPALHVCVCIHMYTKYS